MSLFDVITEETALDMMKTTYQQATGNEISALLNQVSPLPDSDGRLFLGLYEKMSTVCLSRSLSVLMTRIAMQWPLLARWSIK
ncbi:hypothetical protein [Vibrio mediterranei]|uniref:hypothetical protein n=1 Tax=Vibrio mediterranei TaxID=689 RepID=UPI00148CC898|nr:hypothetical protein [Vibrio mediterranei]NOI23855.1 hypothetical protein [Vibrio mediterranei]